MTLIQLATLMLKLVQCNPFLSVFFLENDVFDHITFSPRLDLYHAALDRLQPCSPCTNKSLAPTTWTMYLNRPGEWLSITIVVGNQSSWSLLVLDILFPQTEDYQVATTNIVPSLTRHVNITNRISCRWLSDKQAKLFADNKLSPSL